MGRNKFQRDITKVGKQYGYRLVGTTGSGHLKFQNEAGHVITVSNSPSSPWAELQVTKMFKKGAENL